MGHSRFAAPRAAELRCIALLGRGLEVLKLAVADDYLALQAWHANLLGILVVVVVLTVRNMCAVTLRWVPGCSGALEMCRNRKLHIVCPSIVSSILPLERGMHLAVHGLLRVLAGASNSEVRQEKARKLRKRL